MPWPPPVTIATRFSSCIHGSPGGRGAVLARPRIGLVYLTPPAPTSLRGQGGPGGPTPPGPPPLRGKGGENRTTPLPQTPARGRGTRGRRRCFPLGVAG